MTTAGGSRQERTDMSRTIPLNGLAAGALATQNTNETVGGRAGVQEQRARVYASAADLGNAIRRLRREQEPQLAIQTLALNAGMHPTYLSGIERGVRNPTWAKLNTLAEALQVPLSRIIHVAEQESRITLARSRIEAEHHQP
jgi:Helix-turn-helix